MEFKTFVSEDGFKVDYRKTGYLDCVQYRINDGTIRVTSIEELRLMASIYSAIENGICSQPETDDQNPKITLFDSNCYHFYKTETERYEITKKHALRGYVVITEPEYKRISWFKYYRGWREDIYNTSKLNGKAGKINEQKI